MARENITKFLEKYAEDEALRGKLNGKSADEVIAIAREMGFEFDKQELVAYRNQVTELDPDQLEKAAGGDVMDVMEDVVKGTDWVDEKLVFTYALVKDFFRGIGDWF